MTVSLKQSDSLEASHCFLSEQTCVEVKNQVGFRVLFRGVLFFC